MYLSIYTNKVGFAPFSLHQVSMEGGAIAHTWLLQFIMFCWYGLDQQFHLLNQIHWPKSKLHKDPFLQNLNGPTSEGGDQ